MKAAPEGEEIEAIEPIERTSRTLQAGELPAMPSVGSHAKTWGTALVALALGKIRLVMNLLVEGAV